jgi:integrase
MGRSRTEIPLNRLKKEGNGYYLYLKHPVFKKTVCFSFGDDSEVQDNLRDLNTILMDKELWRNPPAKTSARIRRTWLGPMGSIKLRGTEVFVHGKKIQEGPGTARITAENEALKVRVEELMQIIDTQNRELEKLRGKKYGKGPPQTLKVACELWFNRWKGRKDSDNAASVEYNLAKFVKHFGENTNVDSLEGREADIDQWLQNLKTKDRTLSDGTVIKGKPIGASHLMQIRVYVLKMLTESNCIIDRKKIARVKKKDLKKSRGAIKWLTLTEAQKVASKLVAPYADAFKIQVAIGLRPDELLTLHRDNFNESFSKLALSPLGELTLKTGPRIVPIPEHLRPLLMWRAQQCEVLFPEPKGHVSKRKRKRDPSLPSRFRGPAEGGKPWRDSRMFNWRYREALRSAAKAAGVKTEMDTRIGRRTCASILLQDNISAEKVAALLGNTPAMILEHYGDPDIASLDLNKNVLKLGIA